MDTITAILSDIIGVYVPIVDDAGNVVPGMAGVDWQYVIAGLFFLVCVWSLFRLIGGLICRNS